MVYGSYSTRFLGILVASFFTAIAYSMIITFEEFNIVLLILVGLSIIFIGGVTLHEIKLLRNFINFFSIDEVIQECLAGLLKQLINSSLLNRNFEKIINQIPTEYRNN